MASILVSIPIPASNPSQLEIAISDSDLLEERALAFFDLLVARYLESEDENL